MIKIGNFPDILKYLEITAALKKVDTTDKYNGRPISTRSNFSKIFEKLIFTQINSSFIKPKLSKSLADFPKNHVTKYALLKIIEKLDPMLNKGNKARAIVMDFSKAFDSLNHNVFFVT